MSAYQACPVAKMEKLLLSTDGSLACEGAEREAINLAKICGSKLLIISVAEIPEFPEFIETPTTAEKLEADVKRHLDSLKENARKEGVSCEIIFGSGVEPYHQIVEEAAKNNVEMIIMGTRGRTGLPRLMVGSVTARVIGHTSGKVLVVPKDARLVLEKILIATDGSIYSEFACREAISILKLARGSLTVLSVAKREENLSAAKASVALAKEIAEKEGIKVETMTLEGEPYEIIVKTADQSNAGLIVMGSHGRSGIEKLFMGSVTERVIGHARCPVLVVKK